MDAVTETTPGKRAQLALESIEQSPRAFGRVAVQVRRQPEGDQSFALDAELLACRC